MSGSLQEIVAFGGEDIQQGAFFQAERAMGQAGLFLPEEQGDESKSHQDQRKHGGADPFFSAG